MEKTKNKKGFTIIEVVLVLAIGGLIFLMVFIGLPSLQRSQRDKQRRNDMARVVDGAIEFQRHNKGQLPWTMVDGNWRSTNNFVMRYVDTEATEYVPAIGWPNYLVATGCTDGFKDPDGECYSFVLKSAFFYGQQVGDIKSSTIHNNEYPHAINVWIYAKCHGSEGDYEVVEGKNNFAIFYKLESGEVCVDNS